MEAIVSSTGDTLLVTDASITDEVEAAVDGVVAVDGTTRGGRGAVTERVRDCGLPGVRLGLLAGAPRCGRDAGRRRPRGSRGRSRARRSLDLYAGVGLFTTFLADAVGEQRRRRQRRVGPRCSRDARRNLHDFPQVRLVGATVERALRTARWGASADVVVLDPPRTGAKKAVAGIAALSPAAHRLRRLRPGGPGPRPRHVRRRSATRLDRPAGVRALPDDAPRRVCRGSCARSDVHDQWPMRFADRQRVRTAGARSPARQCPHCGLDLTSHEIRQLWQTLLQADELLARATLKRNRAVLTPPPPDQPAQPIRSLRRRRRRPRDPAGPAQHAGGRSAQPTAARSARSCRRCNPRRPRSDAGPSARSC